MLLPGLVIGWAQQNSDLLTWDRGETRLYFTWIKDQVSHSKRICVHTHKQAGSLNGAPLEAKEEGRALGNLSKRTIELLACGVCEKGQVKVWFYIMILIRVDFGN